MLSFLPGPVKGSLSFLLIVINTVFWSIPLFTLALVKFLVPLAGPRKVLDAMLNGVARAWINCNNANLALVNDIEWRVEGLTGLERSDWYLVMCNHQSWSDILVLQRVLDGKVPFLKFFLKKELIWVPILGLAWWALDFPFMRRYSKEFLEKNPHLKGKDLETTRKACEKFATNPISVMNFVEGTRFTPAKHKSQGSPYARLLKPKAAGVAFVLGAMGGQIRTILDVTIVYPGGAGTIWDFLCGRVPEVVVKVKALPVEERVVGDYFGDEIFREGFQSWLNDLWAAKDADIEAVLAG